MIAKLLGMLESGDDSALLRYSIGNAYFADKKFAEAIVHFEMAVEQDPGYSAAWKLLGRCYYELQDFANAVRVYEQGIAVAAEKGDKQAEKEMTVFKRRAVTAIDKDT